MFKHGLVAILLSVLTFAGLEAAPACARESLPDCPEQVPESPDSIVFAALGNKLAEYVAAIAPLDNKAKETECDFLINTCRDSLTRQYVATWLYRHYMSSPVMGVEEVAIYLTDNWFASGKVKMPDEVEMMNARIYADFNRQSLIGCSAPGMTLRGRDGTVHDVFGGNDAEETELPVKRYSVLFFYDTGCPNCLAQTILLRNLFQDENMPLDLYAVYVGADSLSWDKYVETRLDIKSDVVKVNHLWDPELDSGFQRKYGVIQTPRLFLVDRDWTIVGRGLDAPALASMLKNMLEAGQYEYGSEESDAFFTELFATLLDGYTVEDVNRLSDKVVERSSADRRMVGDLFYYLSYQMDGRLKEGCKYVIDKYILPNERKWSSENDSLAVLGYARTMEDLLSRAEVGTRITDLVFKGKLARGGVPADMMPAFNVHGEEMAADSAVMSAGKRKIKSRSGAWHSGKLSDGTYVMFFSKTCGDCQENLAAVDALMSADKDMKVLFIDMNSRMFPGCGDDEVDKWFDRLDLSSTPYILRFGKGGIVTARYVDFRRF